MHLPFRFWDDAFQTACYLINRLPTKILHNISPFEKLFTSSPNHSFLKIFGCACWPNLRPYNTHKLQPRSLQCVFLGYSLMHKGYKCFHIPTGRLYISRDVLFEESIFPFLESSISSSASSPTNAPAGIQNTLVQLISTGPCVPASSPQARNFSPSSTEPMLHAEPMLSTAPVLPTEPIPCIEPVLPTAHVLPTEPIL